MPRCPGQDQRFWKPGDIFEVGCPECGAKVEFWKDEPAVKCPKCKNQITNPKLDMGCAEWCQYAKECLGVTGKDSKILCNSLIEEMRKVFGDDQKRISHALNVLKYASEIQLAEGGDPLVVKAAAILHDIAILEAEKKHGSAAGNFHQIEGPPIAKAILEKHGVEAELVEHICKIIANHHDAGDIDTLEFQIIRDADQLVNIPEEFGDADKGKLKNIIERTFKTDKGRQLATELFIGG